MYIPLSLSLDSGRMNTRNEACSTLKSGDMLEVCDGRGGVMVGELLDVGGGGGGGGGRVVSIHPIPAHLKAFTRLSVF